MAGAEEHMPGGHPRADIDAALVDYGCWPDPEVAGARRASPPGHSSTRHPASRQATSAARVPVPDDEGDGQPLYALGSAYFSRESLDSRMLTFALEFHISFL